MQPFAVDVPVSVNIWIRPECQKKQFEVIRQARPSILFVTSDGGRSEDEWNLILKNRELYEKGIDWECKVYYLYENKNNGMYAMGQLRRNFIWSKVDRCIFLEDDQIPSVSFFRFCAEMLEKYKDDLRVLMICGMNQLGIYEDASADYFFSNAGSIWGVAMWKRTCNLHGDFSFGEDPYVMKCIKNLVGNKKEIWKQFETCASSRSYDGHPAGDEFFLSLMCYGENQLLIVPKKNLISNIGSTENSAHAGEMRTLPRGIRRVFNIKTYELKFPLVHPKFIINDVDYEKQVNRIMGVGHPFVQIWRKAERFFLILRYEGMSALIKKMHFMYKRSKSQQIEK